MSYQAASAALYDGYLSDVQSVGSSVAHQSVDNDLVMSTKVLEQHFKDKYKVLRTAYEQRIKLLSEVVQETCTNLFSDELLNEMKNDPASSAFIPAHLSEIINNHLESERERFLHQLVTKLSGMELDLAKATDENNALNSKVASMEKDITRGKKAESSVQLLKVKVDTLETQNKDLLQRTEKEISELKNINHTLTLELQNKQSEIDKLTHSLKEKGRECELYKTAHSEKEREVYALGQSFEESARELAIVEGMDREEQVKNHELREQLAALTTQRNALHKETQSLRSRLQHSEVELQRHATLQQQAAVEEERNREKIADLMAQVQEMLTQEANESNLAITTIHEKMRQFRTKLSQDLNKEKRLSTQLQQEIAHFKATNDDFSRENRRLLDNEVSLRDKIHTLESRINELKSEISELNNSNSQLKLNTTDLEARIKTLQETLSNYDRNKQLELQLIQEKTQLAAEKQHEHERSVIESHTTAYKLRYNNELSAVQNQLRHSYTFGTAINENLIPLNTTTNNNNNASNITGSGVNQLNNSIYNATDLSTEISFKNAVQQWAREKAQIIQTCESEKTEFARKLKTEFESEVSRYKTRLTEAGDNIEKMRVMLAENKAALTEKTTIIEQLEYKNKSIQQLLVSVQAQLAQQQALTHHQQVTITSQQQQPQQPQLQGGNNSGFSTPQKAIQYTNTTSNHSANQNSSMHISKSVYDKILSPSGSLPSSSRQASLARPPLSVNSGVGGSSTSINNSSIIGLGGVNSVGVNGGSNFAALHARQSANIPITATNNGTRRHSTGGGVSGSVISASNIRSNTPEREKNIINNNGGGAVQMRIQVPQTDLNAAHEKANRLQQALSTAESALSAANNNNSQLKAVLGRKYEDLVHRYRELSQQFEAYKVSFNNRNNQSSTCSRNKHNNKAASRYAGIVNNGNDNNANDANDDDNDGQSVVSSIFDNLTSVASTNVQQQQRQQQQQHQLKNAHTSPNQSQLNNSNNINNTINSNSTATLQSITLQLEERLQHEISLHEITTVELKNERENVIQRRANESKYYNTLMKIKNEYQKQINNLHSDLKNLRHVVSNILPYFTMERQKAMAQLSQQFQQAFLAYKKQFQAGETSRRIVLTKAHENDMTLLESRFIAQVTEQERRHSAELESQHSKLMKQFESAMMTSSGDHAQPALTSALSTTYQGASTTTNTTSTTTQPAHASVLKGVLEGLQSSDIITVTDHSQLMSLCNIHNEPSLAATVSARSLVGDCVEAYSLSVSASATGGGGGLNRSVVESVANSNYGVSNGSMRNNTSMRANNDMYDSGGINTGSAICNRYSTAQYQQHTPPLSTQQYHAYQQNSVNDKDNHHNNHNNQSYISSNSSITSTNNSNIVGAQNSLYSDIHTQSDHKYDHNYDHNDRTYQSVENFLFETSAFSGADGDDNNANVDADGTGTGGGSSLVSTITSATAGSSANQRSTDPAVNAHNSSNGGVGGAATSTIRTENRPMVDGIASAGRSSFVATDSRNRVANNGITNVAVTATVVGGSVSGSGSMIV